MAKIELKTESLRTLLDLCGLGGNLEHPSILLNVTATSIKASAANRDEKSTDIVISGVLGVLEGTFEEIGELGIGNLSIVRKFLATVTSEKLSLKKTENKLVFETGKSRFSETLRNPKYITNVLQEENFNKAVTKVQGNNFTLKKEDVKKIIQAYRTLPSAEIQIAGKDKTLIIQLTNDSNELTLNFDLEDSIELFKIKFLDPFMQLLSQLGDHDVKFSMRDKSPAYLKVEDENLNVQYLVAPIEK